MEASTRDLEAVEGAALGELILPLAPHAHNGPPRVVADCESGVPKIVE